MLLVFMAGACAGGIKVEETNGDSIEPIPTLPDDRPLLLEVLPLPPSIDDEQEDEQEPAETAPVAPGTVQASSVRPVAHHQTASRT